MKLKFTFACIAVTALAVGFAASSEASITLSVNFDSATYFVGKADPGTPSNQDDQVGYINYLVGLDPDEVANQAYGNNKTRVYTRSDLAGSFDAAVLLGNVKQDTSATVLSLPNTFQYVYGKYGNVGYVWYSQSGFSGDVTLPSSTGDGGLSHSSAYNIVAAVPEAGSLLVWGSLVLTGLCLCRRKLFA